MVKKHWRYSGWLALLAICSLPGCTTQQPLISHAHLGHALTAWHDTPDQQGLLDVAAADLDTAIREAQLACTNMRGATTQQHAANVLHALVPEATADGPASGYGAVRALMGTVEHLEYAATSPDASLNLVAAVADLAGHGVAVHARLEVATELAQDLINAGADTSTDLCSRLQQELHVAQHGGVVGPADGGFATIGFSALHQRLLATLEGERDPAYEPVSRRYVLGLVRLPSGEWRYLKPQTNDEGPVFFGYGY